MALYSWNDGGGAKILRVLEGGVWKLATDAACCCGGANCYLLRTCKVPSNWDSNGYCAAGGCNFYNAPVVIVATINGVPRNLVASVVYSNTYGDLGGMCAFQQGLDEWYVTWNDTGTPPDGTGYWRLVNNTAGIFMNGPTDQPCDPVGAYSDGGGNTGSVAVGNPLVCEYLCENDIVTNTNLSAEFAAGKIIKYGSQCYNIVCVYSCTDGYGGTLYNPTSLGVEGVNWSSWDSCSMCIANCLACDPPMPSVITLQIGEKFPGQFPTPTSGSYTGTFVFNYWGVDPDLVPNGTCYWFAYIGYDSPGGNCFTTTYEHIFWFISSDLIVGEWHECTDSADIPDITPNGFLLWGYFFWGGASCDGPCVIQPQSDPETWIYARNVGKALCSFDSNTCNDGVPCSIQNWYIANFTGLLGDWVNYNNWENLLGNAGGCFWNNGALGSYSLQLTWDGSKWVLTLDTTFGGGNCFAIWHGPTDPCNPVGSYTYISQQIGDCGDPGTDASASTALVKANY